MASQPAAPSVHDQLSLVFYDYVEQRSRADAALNDPQRKLICESTATNTKEIHIKSTCSQKQLDDASNLANALREAGDLLDSFLNDNPQVRQPIEAAMNATVGSDSEPDTVSLIQTLSLVVTLVFECENGHGELVASQQGVVVFE